MPEQPDFKNMRTTRGFTIVELLIVVVVIAVLAAITIVSFQGISRQAKETSIKTELGSHGKSLETDKVTKGGFSASSLMPYLDKDTTNATLSYRYGDVNTFCINATSKTDPLMTYYVSSANGVTAATPGTCPTPTNIATTRCVTGDVIVTVTQTNYTSESVTIVFNTIYGTNTTTALPGATSSIAFNARIPNAPNGVASIQLSSNGSSGFNATHFIRFDGRSC